MSSKRYAEKSIVMLGGIDLNDIKGIDLNLLKAFVVLLEERNVTYAADRLRRGQSATSGMLARLRDMLGDEVLVRSGRDMVPTPRAQELLLEIKPMLERLSVILNHAPSFDPRKTKRQFRIGLPDDLELALLPSLSNAIAKEAPNAQILVKSIDYETVCEAIDKNEIDLAVTVYEEPQESWHSIDIVGDTRFACVFAPETLLADPQDLEDFVQARHALVSVVGDAQGIVDISLQQISRMRKISFVVPHFMALPPLLQAMDLIATVPDYVAARFVQDFDLSMCAPPIDLPPYPIKMMWHRIRERDNADIWFRSLVKRELKQVLLS
ncbi:LysR family transcriptional regulator [Cohaesibacter gelatinilyticus]|uniref:Transcriptional regulator, LysR family n=1 Tax=Cohaesibacter gelatinilyticus TaxID=372072 RepID=A0A285PDS6_9HYPH|nr:LysR family transcriptional regulator [Cohaesibacter gelatinilyticus]SNZ19598.1 transcriptional regulator, LysR family [Cohaesibacter gelatinilyticus]HAT86985.1 LysR family transcriptional regulator [Hyphomicrobiales bacterium]